MFYQSFDFHASENFRKEYGTNFNFPAHLHSSFELIIVLEGNMSITVDSSVYNMQKGDSVLIFPHQVHSLKSEKSKHMLFIFSPKLISAYSSKKMGFIPENNELCLDDYIINELSHIDTDSSKFEIKGALYTVCGRFDAQTKYKKAYLDNENLLFKIFSFVEENFGIDCSLSSCAKHTGYDYTYISRYFKRTTGISYNQHVNSYRLNHAGYLLHNSDKSVLEISEECGFDSLRTFNRNFKEFYKMTPVQYKKNL